MLKYCVVADSASDYRRGNDGDDLIVYYPAKPLARTAAKA